jgi:hypothetical protein
MCLIAAQLKPSPTPGRKYNNLTVDENSVHSISVLAVLSYSFRRRIRALLVEPPLTKLEHVPVGEYLRYVAHETFGRQGVAPPEGLLAVFDLDATVEERKLRRRLHLAEHLSYGELLVEEEPLGERCGEGDVACRNARDLPAAEKVNLATLGYGLVRRGVVGARRRNFINGFDVDGTRKEGAASYCFRAEHGHNEETTTHLSKR